MLCVRRGIVRVKRGSRSSSHQSLLRRTFECDRTDLLRNVFDRSIDVELRLRITGSRSRSAYRSKVSSEAGTPGACAVRVVEWVYLGLIVISSTPSGTTLSPKPTFALAPAMAEHGQAALDGRSRFCRANRMQARDARGTLPDIALEALWCAPHPDSPPSRTISSIHHTSNSEDSSHFMLHLCCMELCCMEPPTDFGSLC